MNLLKMCGPQFRLRLFTFRPIASKLLKILTTIDTFSWLGDAVVTHSLGVQEDPQHRKLEIVGRKYGRHSLNKHFEGGSKIK